MPRARRAISKALEKNHVPLRHKAKLYLRSYKRLALRRHRAIISHIDEYANPLKVIDELPYNGPKDAIPIKDNFVTTDLPTTCASRILLGFRGQADSTVARLLDQALYGVVAKTNMDEFGMGSHSVNSAHGKITNGWQQQTQSVGGSSGGSAICVANMACNVAIGSDTGGSIRLPAAYCGIVGFKPSYGRISRNGLIPYANSLDTVGIMAKTVPEVTQIFKILNVPDTADPTCLDLSSRERIDQALLLRGDYGSPQDERQLHIRLVGLNDPVELDYHTQEAKSVFKRHYAGLTRSRPSIPRRLRIGVPDEYNIDEIHPLIRTAWSNFLTFLSRKGHDIVPCSLPSTRNALAAYYILAPAEASSNLAKYDGVRYGHPRSCSSPDDHGGVLYAAHRGSLFGPEVQRRILLGTFSLSAGAMDNYFIQAQKVRRLVQDDFNAIFRLGHPLLPTSRNNPEGVDLIVVPTAPTLPPLHSELEEADPLDSYTNDVFTVPASLAGLPAISLPVFDHGSFRHTPDMNLGIQIIGQYGDDMALLDFAKRHIEQPRTIQTEDPRVWRRKLL